MPQNFSRHEQLLRIFALLDILATAHQPLDDQTLISSLRERLGLSRLSARTLHRDCDFLLSCGYPIDRASIVGDRRSGWQMNKSVEAGRRIPVEPLTLLELLAFRLSRELLRTFDGTVLWTGIESLRHKLERDMSPDLLERLRHCRQMFVVERIEEARYADRPRLISTLSNAITDHREIEIEEASQENGPIIRRLRPHKLIVRSFSMELVAYPSDDTSPSVQLDISKIQKITLLDATFVPRPCESLPSD